MADKENKQQKMSLKELSERTWGQFTGNLSMMLHSGNIPGLNTSHYFSKSNNKRYHKVNYSKQNKNGDFFAHYPDHHHLTILDYCNYEDKFGQYTLNFTKDGDEYLLNQDAGPNSHNDLSSVGVKLTEKYGPHKEDGSKYTTNYAGSFFNRTSNHDNNYTNSLDTLGNFMIMVHNNYASKDDQILFRGVPKPVFKQSLRRANKLRWKFLKGYKKHFGDYKSRINYDNQNVSEVKNGSATRDVYITRNGKKHVKKVSSNQFNDWEAPYKDHTYKLLDHYVDYPQDATKDPKGFQKAKQAFLQMPAVKFLCTTRGLDPNNVYRDMRKDLVRSYNEYKTYEKIPIDDSGRTEHNKFGVNDLIAQDKSQVNSKAINLATQLMYDKKILTPAKKKKLDRYSNSSLMKNISRYMEPVMDASESSDTTGGISQDWMAKCAYNSHLHLPDYLNKTNKKRFFSYRQSHHPKNAKDEAALEVKYAWNTMVKYQKKNDELNKPYKHIRDKIMKKVLPIVKHEYMGNYDKKKHAYFRVKRYHHPKVEFPWREPRNLVQANSKHPDQSKEKVVGNDIIYLYPNDVYHTDPHVPRCSRGKKIKAHSKHNYAYNIKYGTGKKNLFVFEAPIDARSFGDDFRKYLTRKNSTVASIGGVGKLKAFKTYLSAQHTGAKDFQNIVIGFDDDHGGFSNVNKMFSNVDRAKYSSKDVHHYHNIMVMVPGVGRFHEGKSFDFQLPYNMNYHRIFPQDKDYNDLTQTFAHDPKALKSKRLEQIICNNQEANIAKHNKGLSKKDIHNEAIKQTKDFIKNSDPQHDINTREHLAQLCTQPMTIAQYTQYQVNMAMDNISNHGKNLEDYRHAQNFFKQYSTLAKEISNNKPYHKTVHTMSQNYLSLSPKGRHYLKHFMGGLKVNGWNGSDISPKDLTHCMKRYGFHHISMSIGHISNVHAKHNSVQDFGKQDVDNTFKKLDNISDATTKVYAKKGYALALRGMVPEINQKSQLETKVGCDTTKDTLHALRKSLPKDSYRAIRHSVSRLTTLRLHNYINYTPVAQHAKKYVENHYGDTKTQDYVSRYTVREAQRLVLQKRQQNQKAPSTSQQPQKPSNQPQL